MTEKFKSIWLNLLVGVFGLIVGLSYLIKFFDEFINTKDLLLGIVLIMLATGWLVYVFISRKARSKTLQIKSAELDPHSYG